MNTYKKNKQKIIIDHYINPNNQDKNILQNEGIYIHSNSCADEMNLVLKWKNDTLINVGFNGRGCAIFLSTTDIFLNLIKNKTKTKIKEIILNYENLLNQSGQYDENLLKELIIYENVKTHLNRLNCAILISNTIQKAIQ